MKDEILRMLVRNQINEAQRRMSRQVEEWIEQGIQRLVDGDLSQLGNAAEFYAWMESSKPYGGLK